MLAKFRAWYLRNHELITWFLISWLCLGGVYSFGRGDYTEGIVLWIIALVNYVFVKKD
jgi:hypothetical protein